MICEHVLGLTLVLQLVTAEKHGSDLTAKLAEAVANHAAAAAEASSKLEVLNGKLGRTEAALADVKQQKAETVSALNGATEQASGPGWPGRFAIPSTLARHSRSTHATTPHVSTQFSKLARTHMRTHSLAPVQFIRECVRQAAVDTCCTNGLLCLYPVGHLRDTVVVVPIQYRYLSITIALALGRLCHVYFPTISRCCNRLRHWRPPIDG